MKRILIMLLFASLFTLTGMSLAQESDTATFYLFDSPEKTIVELDTEGAENSYSLNLPEDVFIGSNDLFFTQDGTEVAYCRLTPIAPASYESNAELVVWNIEQQAEVFTKDFESALGCVVSDWSREDNMIAVGTVNYFPNSPQAETATKPMWMLQVIDIGSGEVVHELTSDSDLAQDMDLVEEVAFLPRPMMMHDGEMIFQTVPWGMGGPAELPAYRWDFEDSSIELVDLWGKSGFARIAETNETAWVDYDDSLPAGQPGGPMPAFNVVKIRDDGGERIIYHSVEWLPIHTVFVNNGEQLAVELLSAFDAENPTDLSSIRWIFINRDGSIVEPEERYLSFTQVEPAPNGYLLLASIYAGENYQPPITAMVTYHHDGMSEEIWSEENLDTIAWGIAYTTPMMINEGLEPFPAFDT